MALCYASQLRPNAECHHAECLYSDLLIAIMPSVIYAMHCNYGQYAECHFAQCLYADLLITIMLSVAHAVHRN